IIGQEVLEHFVAADDPAGITGPVDVGMRPQRLLVKADHADVEIGGGMLTDPRRQPTVLRLCSPLQDGDVIAVEQKHTGCRQSASRGRSASRNSRPYLTTSSNSG